MPDFSFTLLLALCVVVGGAALLVLHRQSSRVADQSVAELRLRIAELHDNRRAPVAQAAPVVSESSERINQAIKLARRGESVESLMSLCALGRGEAELLVKLHYRADVEANSDAA